jgi:cardiolipin synthase A/B
MQDIALTNALLFFAIGGVVDLLLTFLIAFFHPGLEYRTKASSRTPVESPDFARLAALILDSRPEPGTRVEVLTDGPCFYEAELAAIREAKRYICLEAYIFQKGEIASRFIEALTERARAGVEVRIVLDAIGSFNTWRSTFRTLIDAGGQVCWYNRFRWYNFSRINNRTHRELVILDGRTAFLGGAGIADHWWKARGRRHPRWRDTMFRVEGPAVSSLVSVFAENWLESSGELLAGAEYYPEVPRQGNIASFIINSSPSFGHSTPARSLFQLLIGSAARSIHVTTPYFLPDRSAIRELVRAMTERRVKVRILVPGKHSDHLLTRRSSRRIYGDLLRHGAELYEYGPSMMHTKCLVVDGLWSVVGSTNFDHRSFGINDEINLAAQDEGLAARLEEDFQRDLARARRVTYGKWSRRPLMERLHEWLGWILERQE